MVTSRTIHVFSSLPFNTAGLLESAHHRDIVEIACAPQGEVQVRAHLLRKRSDRRVVGEHVRIR